MAEQTAFMELEAHVKAIRLWLDKGKAAEGWPDIYAVSARKIAVNGNTHYDNDKLALAKAREIKDRAEAEMRAAGEERRDQELVTVRTKVETYRVRLPDLSAKACIELGVIARGLTDA